MVNSPPPCILTIGNFDGVHAGHRALLARAQNVAMAENLPLHVLTFTPHPRTVVRPNTPHQALMNDTEKEQALLNLGVDAVHVLPFTLELAAHTPAEFEQHILQTLLNAKHIIIGENFRYGQKAAGTPKTLQQSPHFTTHTVPLLTDEQGIISSTRLRAAQ